MPSERPTLTRHSPVCIYKVYSVIYIEKRLGTRRTVYNCAGTLQVWRPSCLLPRKRGGVAKQLRWAVQKTSEVTCDCFFFKSVCSLIKDWCIFNQRDKKLKEKSKTTSSHAFLKRTSPKQPPGQRARVSFLHILWCHVHIAVDACRAAWISNTSRTVWVCRLFDPGISVHLKQHCGSFQVQRQKIHYMC